ncbi:hypothetical protein [Schleiferilactobacillus harbinensis]|uniref:Uncharacterized protein n=1 Tax=Schleiferilactobacillus harbinensis TaxID=304207 RepID=A0A5P8M579_9LACO|nr:hypothetical protein [Schleiferilactobacillus harbinensis]QFR23668.1 hypothetical protein D1010_09755 [Schleiferilactobacillus harbinensis]
MTDKERRAHDLAIAFVNSYLSSLPVDRRIDEFSEATSVPRKSVPNAIDIYLAVYDQALKRM